MLLANVAPLLVTAIWAKVLDKSNVNQLFEIFNQLIFNLAGPIPLRVREAEIPIVSDAECIRKVNAVTEKIFILPASSFCAGGEEGNDACQVKNKLFPFF